MGGAPPAQAPGAMSVEDAIAQMMAMQVQAPQLPDVPQAGTAQRIGALLAALAGGDRGGMANVLRLEEEGRDRQREQAVLTAGASRENTALKSRGLGALVDVLNQREENQAQINAYTRAERDRARAAETNDINALMGRYPEAAEGGMPKTYAEALARVAPIAKQRREAIDKNREITRQLNAMKLTAAQKTAASRHGLTESQYLTRLNAIMDMLIRTKNIKKIEHIDPTTGDTEIIVDFASAGITADSLRAEAAAIIEDELGKAFGAPTRTTPTAGTPSLPVNKALDVFGWGTKK